MLRHVVLGVAVAALLPLPAVAQTGQFSVGPRLGYINYDTETGLESAGILGLDATYRINRNIGIGFTVDVGRPTTDSSFFPAEMSFGDTTFVFAVSQPVTVVNYHLMLEATTGGTFAPFLLGSVGGYRMTLDPQVGGNEDVNELGFSFGGGISFQTSGGTAIRLEARDFVFTNFDREVLYPVEQRFRPTRFPQVLPTPAPFDGTAHNIIVSLAFSFTPGGSQ